MADLLQKGMEETILLKVSIIHNSFILIRAKASEEIKDNCHWRGKIFSH
ncbi:MAG: hypothetical protein OEZ30_04400 [Candidatus Aminicenantes bacterium]|nr:hypothetical protein [Candidatus Aminicenantes bacterium]MDH5714786.1 hypothetical protein [Candidatus Aminicenantes bacterium]